VLRYFGDPAAGKDCGGCDNCLGTHDRTLMEMAVRRPKSPYALGEIHGVGPMKIEKYGELFLAVLRAADETEAA
jgi:hypothetical protein